ncbi:MAG: YbhB/YbcL family Raf kinase inhibitor-like protein [bacterium]|nr:YbhB/YbcL family Raf kinase inhibitor-like protein [bacterium]
MKFTLAAESFTADGEIPVRHTCEGRDVSPPLRWSGAPEGTRSFALIVDDPDAPDPRAPRMTWVHWVLYNLPASFSELPEGLASADLPEGARQGLNDWKQPRYGGPCPPIGRHRYFHKLHALDIVLPDMGAMTKQQLKEAMTGHVLGTAELVGTYQKRG